MVALVDFPRDCEPGCQSGDLIGPGKIPVDQSVESRKTEKAETLTAIIWDPCGGRDVGGGHRNSQRLPKSWSDATALSRSVTATRTRGSLRSMGTLASERKPVFCWLFRALTCASFVPALRRNVCQSMTLGWSAGYGSMCSSGLGV